MEKGIELATAFSRFYTQLEESGMISREVITDYAKANYHGLHSLLNSALIRARISISSKWIRLISRAAFWLALARSLH